MTLQAHARSDVGWLGGREPTTEERLRHDLRQSVGLLMALASVVQQDIGHSSEVLAHLDQMQRETTRMAELVSARVETADAPQRVDVGQVVSDAWRSTVAAAPCRMKLVCDAAAVAVVDPVTLARSVQNLLDNAVRAAGADGAVVVQVRDHGDTLSVAVSDTGPGFGNVPTQQGLGLLTVRHFAAEAGGTLEVAASPDGGASVVLRIPSATRTEGDAHVRLVICDDHTLLLQALATALAGCGMTVEATATSPAEAVRAVALHDPDLLLTDLCFPDGSGLDAARGVMAHHPRTKVVVMTGSDQPEALLDALSIGVAGYVAKDRPIEALAHALAEVARGRTVIDRDLVRAAPGAGRVPAAHPRTSLDILTATERRVMELMAEGLGTSEIVQALGVTQSTVRTHVQNILTKLGVHSRLQAVALLPVGRAEDRHVSGL